MGLGIFLERTQILSGIQFTRHFVELAVVARETKRFVSSNVNVLLTRQTCGQSSSLSAGSKHREIIFPSKFAICFQYQNVEETDALFEYLHMENRCAMSNSDFSCGRNTFFFGSRHCTVILFSQVCKKCTDLDLGLIYILILGTYNKFARKNDFLSFGVCFPQSCLSAGRRFAASRSCLRNYRRIVSFLRQKFG